MLRFLLWRLLGVLAVFAGLALIAWFTHGGPGAVLRGHGSAGALHPIVLAGTLAHAAGEAWGWTPVLGREPAKMAIALALASACLVAIARAQARRRRRYVRLRVAAYRGDHAPIDAVVAMYEVLHKRLLQRWWRRLALGQPSLSLEVHHTGGGVGSAWLAVTCIEGHERIVEASLQAAYPNCRLARTRSARRRAADDRAPEEASRVHQAGQVDRGLRASIRATDRQADDGHGGVRRAGVRATRGDADAGVLRSARQASVQAP